MVIDQDDPETALGNCTVAMDQHTRIQLGDTCSRCNGGNSGADVGLVPNSMQISAGCLVPYSWQHP
jgi:hypothetical protein